MHTSCNLTFNMQREKKKSVKSVHFIQQHDEMMKDKVNNKHTHVHVIQIHRNGVRKKNMFTLKIFQFLSVSMH